eukprot:scaffold190001_cov25-Prasinocladus_malaysianus.AAC.1
MANRPRSGFRSSPTNETSPDTRTEYTIGTHGITKPESLPESPLAQAKACLALSRHSYIVHRTTSPLARTCCH